MRFTDIFIRRPVLAVVVSLLILLIGARSLYSLPIRQYPLLSNTVITVTTAYPGAPADLMQGFITQPIAQAVASAEGLDYLTSSSTQNTSTITAYVKLNFDPNKAMTDVMAKVQQVKYLIPKEANDPVITKSTGDTTAIMYIGFSSPQLSGAAITDYLSRVVQPLLATVDGVASADILGGQTFAMRVWLDPLKMAARGVTGADVALAIQSNNFQSAPGQAKGYFTVTNVTADTGLTNLDQFKQMTVKAQGGSLVRLQDIATIDLGAQNTNSSVMMSGQEAVFIGVQPTPAGNPLTIVKGVRDLQPTIERGLPPTVKMSIVYDSTKFIQSSINEVIRTLIEALAIVVVVIFLFLGTFRSVVIPVVTIPLSLVGAGMIMLAFGFSLNLLTLLAMVLAIGLVVDDAIVVVENIYRHIEEGLAPIEAAVMGAREIVGPVIAMTITLAAVYAPIGLLSGLTGTLFREFAFTLAGAVIISGIIALTLSPMMCSVLLTREMSQGWFARRVDHFFSAVTRWYGRRLVSSLNYRAADGAFRPRDRRQPGLPVHPCRRRAGAERGPGRPLRRGQGTAIREPRLHRRLQQGARHDLSLLSRDPGDLRRQRLSGPEQQHLRHDPEALGRAQAQRRSAAALVQNKISSIAGMSVFAFNLPPLPGSTGGMPVQLVINSPADFEQVFKTMEAIKDRARKSGLFIVTDSDLAFNNPTVHLRIDRSKANDLGITMADVGSTLALLVGENYVNRFNLQGRSYEVIPQVPRADRLAPEQLSHYFVKTRSGGNVPLSTVVSIETGIDPNALTQYNQLNSATFSAVPMPGITMGQAVAYLEQLTQEILPKDFNHDYLSESRQYVREGNQLTVTFVFALIIIYLVLCGAVREPARSAGDPGQRADVDLRRAAAALHGAGDHEHLYPGRPGDPDRPDQQARHPHGRVRQCVAAHTRSSTGGPPSSGRPRSACARS